MTDRRTFLKLVPAACVGMAVSPAAFANSPKLKDTDPQAIAMGYKTNAAQVDKAKSPRYAAGQKCANCVLFQAKPGDAWGQCGIFAGKLVAAGAWCNAYAKKG